MRKCVPSTDQLGFHRNIVALHFCEVTLTAKKPLSEAYPKTLNTLGDHRRKRRLDLKLFQKDVANIIGVDTNSIINWEKNRSSPRLYLLPKVFEFLGYNPLRSDTVTIGDRIRQYRVQNGLSLGKLAKRLGIDPTTLARWERGQIEPKGKLNDRVNLFLMNLTK